MFFKLISRLFLFDAYPVHPIFLNIITFPAMQSSLACSLFPS
jgi:hypothetical protein